MKDLIQATSLSYHEFNKKDSISEYSLIVLANLQNLEKARLRNWRSSQKTVEEYLSVQGIKWTLIGTMIHGGPRVVILPMPIKGTQGNLQNELSFQRFPVLILSIPHSPCLMIRGTEAWRKHRLKKWVVMDETKIRNDPTVTVLARLINGQPILAEKNSGREWSSFGAHLLTLIGQSSRKAKLPSIYSTNRILSF